MNENFRTIRTQIVMDYDDFTRVMEEYANKIVTKVLELMEEANKTDGKSELLTAKEVRSILGVTDKTLHVWNKTGFLPRIRIGGVVRYHRADIERVSSKKNG